MKKLFLTLSVTFMFLSFMPISFAKAEDNKSYFAKVQSTGVNFCSSPNEASALFEIPNSYFVKVQSVVDEYFKVSYRDLEGYVKKDTVTLMDGTPITPYANATYNIYTPYNLYENASKTTSVAALDESMSISYYGTKVGQQLKFGIVDWIYSSVLIDGNLYYGYVYSDLPETPIHITKNNETFDIVSEGVLFPSTSTSFGGLSIGTKIILIVAISVPSVLILYFLIKPSKIMQITKSKQKPKSRPKFVRHGDYFEFDESEL